MAFFANSGVAWPGLEERSREAGAEALDAASELWAVFAQMEALVSDGSDNLVNRVRQVSARFRQAAVLYREISDHVDDSLQPPLSGDEFLLAAIDDFYILNLSTDIGESPVLNLGNRFSIKRLYINISNRFEALAEKLDIFNPLMKKEYIAPAVFKLMHEWESLAKLGRLIAVVNRRHRVSRRDSFSE